MAHDLRTSPADQSNSDSVTVWRVTLLCAAGFDREPAEKLANDGVVDLHALIDLVERGCPPALAVRILAPIESVPSR
jgi:hypothetical protein